MGGQERTADVVVIGAGVIGAACAYFAARAGLGVHVVDRDGIASGTTSAGEGNVLVSDKEPGPELDLALYSRGLWDEFGESLERWEFEEKGGLVVVGTEEGAKALASLADRQRKAGVDVVDVGADGLAEYEPNLTPGLRAGAFYPQDAQVQPMRLAAELLRLARRAGAVVTTGDPVRGLLRSGSRVTGVRTDRGDLSAAAVVNAAGTWARSIGDLAGVAVPIEPRRGFILVTEPLPRLVRHKVYAGEYVANVASADEGLQVSPVVEGTPSGTILIGSSRERVGFDREVSLPVLRALAQNAVGLFPVLAGVRVLRSYAGFRPYSPDHLPIIGEDPRAPGLWHACGHEGAGIGLSLGTGRLLAQSLGGARPDLDLAPFAPERFEEVR